MRISMQMLSEYGKGKKMCTHSIQANVSKSENRVDNDDDDDEENANTYVHGMEKDFQNHYRFQ